MLRTGSTPPSSPPWSAPDSIGYAVWNRLTQYGVPPSGAGITVSGNTSAIHDRHMSFIGALTAQPPGLRSPAPPRRVDDIRVFRRAAVSAAAIVGQRWPIPVSNIVTADSALVGLQPQAATVIRDTAGPSLTASLGGEAPAMNHAAEAAAWAVMPAGRPELFVSMTGVESRVMRQRSFPALPLTTTDATVALTLNMTARGPLAPVSQPVAHAGMLGALSNKIGTSSRAWDMVHGASWVASEPSSLRVAVDRGTASATLTSGADVIAAKAIATPSPGGSFALVSRPAPASSSAPMSFVPPPLIRPISNTGFLQQSDVLFRAAPPPLANDVRRSSGGSATIIRSITDPSITQPIQYNQTILSRAVSKPVDRTVILENRAARTDAGRRDPAGLRNDRHRLFPVATLPINASISVGPITREHDADRQMIQSAVSLYAQSTMPEFPPAETGILLLPSGPMATRQPEGARGAASSSSIPLQSGLVVPLLELRDRRDDEPERGVLRVAPPEVGVARAKMALSERSVDLPVGSSPAAPGRLALLGTQHVVPRAEAVGDQAFPLITLARAGLSPTVLDDLAVTSHDIFVSSPSDGGSAGAIVPAPSASLPPQFASAGRSPLAQVDRAPGYFERGVLRVAPPEVGVARAKMALSERSVDLPVGASPVFPTRSAFPGIQLEPFRAKGGDLSVSLLADVVRSPAAQRRQAEPPVISDSIISVIEGAGEPMKFTLAQPRFAGTRWPLTRPLAGVVRSPEAQLRHAEPPVISDSLIAAAGRTGEPMMFTSAQPRFGDSTWSLARSLTTPEVVGRHASGGGAIFVDLPNQSVVSGPSAHRAFDGRGLSFPSGSYNGFSTEPRRSDLPLRVAARRYDAATPSIRSSAAGAQVLVPTPIAVVRAESPGSALYDPAASAVMPGPGTSVDVGPRSDTSPPAPSPDSGADADDIIERTWREVMSRLAIEQERRGFGRWS